MPDIPNSKEKKGVPPPPGVRYCAIETALMTVGTPVGRTSDSFMVSN